MKVFALGLVGFFFPLLLTVVTAASLYGLTLTVYEELDDFYYTGGISAVVSENEALFPLVSFNDSLKEIFATHQYKTRSELYEIALGAFKEYLLNIGEFHSKAGQKVFSIYEKKVKPQSSSTAAPPDFLRMNSVGSIDFSNLGGNLGDFDFTMSMDNFDDFMLPNENIPLPTIGSLLDVPVPSAKDTHYQSVKRTLNGELWAKKWALAVSKLSRFPMKIYTFVKGLQDRTLAPVFFSATKIIENLKKTFNELAETKAEFNERSIADYLSIEVDNFVKTLTVSDENVIDLFVASIMETGSEIYKEIKDEIKDKDNYEELTEKEIDQFQVFFENDTKRQRIGSSPISSAFYEPPAVAEFKDEEKLEINPTKDEDDEDGEGFVDIATPEQLELSETKEFLNNPFDLLNETISNTNIEQFDQIRGIYYGLVERDFSAMDQEAKDMLSGILDFALNKVYNRK